MNRGATLNRALVYTKLLARLPTLVLAVPSKHVLIGNVVKVTDGDTITVLTADNVKERIRLFGIDAQ